ncbi:MAG: hypothetical protein LBB89_03765 [Treponema sp.]|nr:hypothetical protein [Treponema sp.]
MTNFEKWKNELTAERVHEVFKGKNCALGGKHVVCPAVAFCACEPTCEEGFMSWATADNEECENIQ